MAKILYTQSYSRVCLGSLSLFLFVLLFAWCSHKRIKFSFRISLAAVNFARTLLNRLTFWWASCSVHCESALWIRTVASSRKCRRWSLEATRDLKFKRHKLNANSLSESFKRIPKRTNEKGAFALRRPVKFTVCPQCWLYSVDSTQAVNGVKGFQGLQFKLISRYFWFFDLDAFKSQTFQRFRARFKFQTRSHRSWRAPQ